MSAAHSNKLALKSDLKYLSVTKCYVVTEPLFEINRGFTFMPMPMYIGYTMTNLAVDVAQQVTAFAKKEDAKKFAHNLKDNNRAVGILTVSIIDAELTETVNTAKSTGIKISLDPKKTLLLEGKCPRLDASLYNLVAPLSGLGEKLNTDKPTQQKVADYFRYYYENTSLVYLFFRDHKALAKEIVTDMESKNIHYSDHQVINYLMGKLEIILKESPNNVTKAFYKTLTYGIHVIQENLAKASLNFKEVTKSADPFRAASLKRLKTEVKMKHPFEVLSKQSTPLKQLLPYDFILKQLKILDKYPDAERYRLIVDGAYHKKEQGWVGYEKREPGCLMAAFNALGVAFADLENPEVNLDLLLRIYHAFTDNVALDTPGLPDEKEMSIPNFRPVNYAPASALYFEWVTEAGILELLNQMEKEHHYPLEEGSVLLPTYPQSTGFSFFMRSGPPEPNYALALHAHSLEAMRATKHCQDNQALAKVLFSEMKEIPGSPWFMLPPCGPIFVKEIDKLLQQFNTQIKVAKTQAIKLELIVGLAYDLEHNHIFKDANLRTTVIAFMNRLLLQHGFTVCTHEEPNIFEGHSKSELVIKVKEAMKITEGILNGEKVIFGFQSKDIPLERYVEYSAMIVGLNKVLASEQARLNSLISPSNSLLQFKI